MVLKQVLDSTYTLEDDPMDPENHSLVEENTIPGVPLSGSMLVFRSVYIYNYIYSIYIYMDLVHVLSHGGHVAEGVACCT